MCSIYSFALEAMSSAWPFPIPFRINELPEWARGAWEWSIVAYPAGDDIHLVKDMIGKQQWQLWLAWISQNQMVAVISYSIYHAVTDLVVGYISLKSFEENERFIGAFTVMLMCSRLQARIWPKPTNSLSQNWWSSFHSWSARETNHDLSVSHYSIWYAMTFRVRAAIQRRRRWWLRKTNEPENKS